MTDPTPSDDRLLVERIRSGDRDALGILYDRYASAAMAVAVRITADREAAEDLVHDAFLAVWQKIDRFDAARGNIRSWTLAIVRNRAIDRVRGQRPRIDTDTADEMALLRSGGGATWDAVAGRLARSELRAALDELSAEQRRAIDLAYFGGHTYREIAVITGVPQGTANGRIRLGLHRLRDRLAGTNAAPLGPEPRRSHQAGGWSRERAP